MRARSFAVVRLVSSSTAKGRSAKRLPESGPLGSDEALEHPADAERVLLGEHLGRRHQRCLVPALYRGEHRCDSNDGLAGPHVALQQAVHRVGAGEVGLDVADGVLLPRR